MVASYSPHRQHGETATLFSRPHSESPSSRHHVVLHSPTSFSISFPTSIKTRSATRRLTPLKPGTSTSTAPDSPIKFPLTLTTHNNMNSSGMTLRSGSSSPRAASPRDKLAAQRQNRAGIGVENKEAHKPSNGSPLKRSDGIMNLNEASRGSPVAKRRSQAGVGLFSSVNKAPVFGSPSFGAKSSASPKRQAGIKKATGHTLSDKPTWTKSRPLTRTEFMPPPDTNQKMRRVTSVENFLAHRDSPFGNTVAPLANPSAHPFNAGNSKPPQDSNLDDDDPDEPWPSSQNSNGLITPQNYKTAKPFPAAFHSTGFIPKRNRGIQTKEHGPQPDTPSKNPQGPPLFGGKRLIMGKTRASMSMTEFASNSSTPNESLNSTTRWKLLARKTSSMSNDDGEDFSSSEYELPPTPTRKVPGGGLFGSVGSSVGSGRNGGGGHKRLRTDTSAEGLRGRYVTNSPQTPRMDPPDLSSVTISGRANKDFQPVTPSPSKENIRGFAFGSSTTTHSVESTEGRTVQVSDNFVKRFTEVKHIGSGQFSEVYQVSEGHQVSEDGLTQHPLCSSLDGPLTPHQLATPRGSSVFGSSPLGRPVRNSSDATVIYAVKKSKSRVCGEVAREWRMTEAKILEELGQHDHILEFFGAWEDDGHLYIKTEFCDGGSLENFLWLHGMKGRLDEFRVWKVLLELSLGLQHIHDRGFVHLDLKPANILISKNGMLKISDFGTAARWPVDDGREREGDRGYIAPEVISHGKYDKPVDVFALGLTIIETAGNETLPPNGPDWQKLREGDISVAPILSTSCSGEFVHRTETGDPLTTEIVDGFSEEPFTAGSPPARPRPGTGRRRSKSLLHKPRSGDLVHPPKFMAEGGLEKLVKWMIKGNPGDRPTMSQLLDRHELRWVERRKRANAMEFEGLWGPDDDWLKGGPSGCEDEDMVNDQSASSEIGGYSDDCRMQEM